MSGRRLMTTTTGVRDGPDTCNRPRNLFTVARACLAQSDVQAKLQAATELQRDWEAGALEIAPASGLPGLLEAGRPPRPQLVHPRDLARRRLGSPEGKAAMLHAIAHIEFNAVNLAVDAVFRFRDMPRDYYADWLKVAAEEAYHFSLLNERLIALGFAYGDFAAHNGLWDLALRTREDPMVRMALVPRVLEARGLDVTPAIQDRFRQVGDVQSCAVLAIILRDEIGHVQIGTRWFRHLCAARQLESEATYFALIAEFLDDEIRCPLHREARLEAGFTLGELDRLEAMCKGGHKGGPKG